MIFYFVSMLCHFILSRVLSQKCHSVKVSELLVRHCMQLSNPWNVTLKSATYRRVTLHRGWHSLAIWEQREPRPVWRAAKPMCGSLLPAAVQPCPARAFKRHPRATAFNIVLISSFNSDSSASIAIFAVFCETRPHLLTRTHARLQTTVCRRERNVLNSSVASQER